MDQEKQNRILNISPTNQQPQSSVLKTVYENGEELVSVNGYKGVLVNKTEIENFRGPVPLSEYPINYDPNPIVLPKKCSSDHQVVQEVTVRYLEPPPLPAPGEIVIQQETPVIPPPAPPIIIRTKPTTIKSADKVVIREAPPKFVVPTERKVVRITGERAPPPPRKVIVQKMPSISCEQARPIVIERWLAPKVPPRRIVLEGSFHKYGQQEIVKNEIHECEAPKIILDKKFVDLGVERADPNDYVMKYGSSLIEWNKLPDLARDLRPPPGQILASEVIRSLGGSNVIVPPLEGDVKWLKYVDLTREGLAEYNTFVQSSVSVGGPMTVSSAITSSTWTSGGGGDGTNRQRYTFEREQ